MKKYLQNYLLTVADSPFLINVLIWVMISILVSLVIDLFTHDSQMLVVSINLSWIVSLALAINQYILVKHYVAKIKDFGDAVLLVKVQNGKVTEFGTKLIRSGDIWALHIPQICDGGITITVNPPVIIEDVSLELSVRFALDTQQTDLIHWCGLNLQEIADKDAFSMERYLKSFIYQTIVKQPKFVLAVSNSSDSGSLNDNLAEAIPKIKYAQPLSNIVGTSITVITETTPFVSQVDL